MAQVLAVLFDLDGTLTDRRASIGAFAEAFVHQFEKRLAFTDEAGGASGLSPAEVVASAIAAVDGGGHERRAVVVDHLLRSLPWTTRPQHGVLEAFWAEAFPRLTRPAEGLRPTLEGLRQRGLRLAVVTNGGAAMQRRKIDALDIRPLLSAMIISGAVGVSKPDTRIFHLALSAIGVDAAQAWFVGDHPVADVLGAKAAGLTPVWHRGALPWPNAGRPAMQIDRIAELFALLDASGH